MLVASRYPNLPEPLWHLPGGRQRHGELLHETLAREFLEETGLTIERGPLAYTSESYDRATGVHFVQFAFSVRSEGRAAVPTRDAHVVACAWVPRAEIAARISVAVVREPLLAHLRDDPLRYHAFDDAGVTIEFADPA